MYHSKRGFSLIELLVAMFVLTFVMIGFLTGILQYMRYTLRTQLNDRAVQLADSTAKYISSLPMNHQFFTRAQAQGYHWSSPPSQPCDDQGGCYFENVNSDGDNIPDFYDPYSENNQEYYNDPTNTAQWLYLGPNRCNIPGIVCQQRFRNTDVFLGITIAPMGPLSGIGSQPVAVGIIVWYFDPTERDTNNRPRYRQVRTLVIRSE